MIAGRSACRGMVPWAYPNPEQLVSMHYINRIHESRAVGF